MSGSPIPAGLPDVPSTYVQGDPHKHGGKECEDWRNCTITSDDQQAYLDAYAIIIKHGKGSPEARVAYSGLADHPWGQALLRAALHMKEST